MRANSFLLSMSSPVLHKMMCGGFKEGIARQILLEDVDGSAFEEVLDLWCGKEGRIEKDMGDVMIMASVADRLEMLDVVAALEDTIISELDVGICAEVLMSSRRLWLRQVEKAAWEMAVARFDEVSGTAGFMELDEEVLGRLLDSDGLGVRTEEEAFEGLVRWMKGGGGYGLRGRELLRKIRYGVMEKEYLEGKVCQVLSEDRADWIDGLVQEALRAKAAARAKAPVELRQLGATALTRRRGRGVEWGRYAGESSSGRRLEGLSGSVYAMAECERRMCIGSEDGSIRIWSMATLEQESVLRSDGDGVYALAAWEGEVISGHISGKIRVWDVASGQRRRELDGHGEAVCALCVCGQRLASGSNDSSIKVWAMGSSPDWPCERTLAGHRRGVTALVGWEGKLISGSFEETIRVWDLGTGALDATLAGHGNIVWGLLVHGERLFSASADLTIRVWAVGTWAALTSVRACDSPVQYPCCLAASGSKLVSGSFAFEAGWQCEVRVWDLEKMGCEHTVRQAAGPAVRCLAVAVGEVWGGVGSEVVVWGRD